MGAGLDLVVVTDVPTLNHALHGLSHFATLGDGADIYIWCWGSSQMVNWARAPAGETATCLQCWFLGPRAGWAPDRMFGGRSRDEMIDGRKFLVVDTETK